jgi:hypothetical protein
LADNYGWTPEAVEARAALARLRRSEGSPDAPVHNGKEAPPALPDARARPAGNYHARRGLRIAPADVAVRTPMTIPAQVSAYRIGSFIAVLMALAGGAALIGGVILLLGLVPGPDTARIEHLSRAFGGAPATFGLLGGGLFMVLAGEYLRAFFAQARATRELAAMARARAEFDAAEAERLRITN